MSSFLLWRGIPLPQHVKVYQSCIRSVVLYGEDTRALIRRPESKLFHCKRKMLRYIVGVTWRGHMSSLEVVKELAAVLRWFWHAERRDKAEILGKHSAC